MRKFGVIACVSLVLLAVAAYVIASAPSISLAMVPQPYSPAALTQTTHTNTDFLAGARLHNASPEPIVAYRIGWIAVRSAGGSSITLGEPMNVPGGIASGSTASVPAQAVNPAKVRNGNRFVGFFVAEASFADGRTWSANLNQLQKQAERQAASSR